MMTSVSPIFLHFGGEHGAEFLAGFGGDAPGAAVGDDAFGVEGGEIGAGADIARLEFHAQPESASMTPRPTWYSMGS